MLGVEPSRLRYWERLRLVHAANALGRAFLTIFGDLVALRTLQRLTDNRHSLAARSPRGQFDRAAVWRISASRFRNCASSNRAAMCWVIPPGAARPFSPLKRQWVFPFDSQAFGKMGPGQLHSMAGPTPEQLFQAALDCETSRETLPQAVESYRRVLDLVPDWVDAHINLGVALYQMGRADEARAEFLSAVDLDPLNGISRYNLGCVLEEQGEIDQAIEHLRRAVRALPAHADVHFNLALAYEKRGERRLAREQWVLYLRHAPNGAVGGRGPRSPVKQCSDRQPSSALIPFPARK